jgi:hypothetical protein
MYEDDFLEAQYEDRFISDMDDEPDLYEYFEDDIDAAELDGYIYVGDEYDE